MKDAKVNMNRPPLSEDDINKSKDFDQLMQMNNEPPIKIKWGRIGGIVAVVAGVLGYVFWPIGKENEAGKKTEVVSQSFNEDFFKETNVQMTEYKVNANKGDTIVTPTGTRVIIPAGAFKDENGNSVSGEVTISFREFHDVPSIFGSNVDMTYDSAGVEYHFESAGMVELYGFQNGKEVTIDENKPLIVELNSHNTGNYFNIYYMDPNGDWEYVSKDTSKHTLQDVNLVIDMAEEMKMFPIVEAKKVKYEKAKSGFEKQVKDAGLIIPQLANDDLFSVKLKFKESQFPELKGYENVLFEVTGENKNFNPDLENEVWSDIQIAKPKDKYIMTLFGVEKVKLIVKPVFASEDMEEAEVNFEELFAAYDEVHEGILSASKDKMSSAYLNYKATQDSVINVINQTLNQAAWSDELYGKSQLVKRVFEVDNFGFWNSDCPQNLPKGQDVSPVFVNADEEKDTLTFENLYIAEYDKNAFFTYWGNWGHKKYLDEKGKEKMMFESPEFTFNPQSETVLWAITNKGELAVITPDELKKISFNKGKATTVKMKLHKQIINVDKIKEAIGWK